MRDQKRQIVQALPQGGYVNAVGGQPEIEVLAEFAGFLQLPEVGIGGGDDPGIRPPGVVAPQGKVFVFLQQTQQFDLGGRAEVADFIQKQGAPRSPLNEPLALGFRTGESPLGVPEEGVGKHVVVQPSHVDCHEMAFETAEVVQGPGDEFLADPGFPPDQNGLRGLGDGFDVLEDGQHFFVAGDDAGKRFGPFQGVGQDVVFEGQIFAPQLPKRHGPVNGGHQPVVLDRLDHVVEGTQLHALNRRLDFHRTGDDNRRYFGVSLVYLLQQLPAVEVRHVQIQQDDFHRAAGQEVHDLAAVLAGEDVVQTGHLQNGVHREQNRRFVVHDQNRVGGDGPGVHGISPGLESSSWSGRNTRAVVPWPAVESKLIRPP